jgi:putrescine---pyruvate transaminase
MNADPASQSWPNPLWHPFADMGAAEEQKLVLVRGEGIWVEDEDGKRYLDATAGLWYSALGHGRPEIAEAVAAQLIKLDAFQIFGDYANRPALELAARLADLSPTAGSKVFFGSGGGDMLDGAAKIARAHFVQQGYPEKTHLISRRHGYHGTHGLGTSLGGIEVNTAGWGRLVPDVSQIDHDSVEALEHEIARIGADRVAAFFCEPVIGAGGVQLPPPGYIEAVAEICRENGVLFVADCVICGFGRLGTWFGIDRWPVEPDMITLAKGITGGAMPLGALIVAGEVAAPFFTGESGAPVLRHGQTYSGHPACCAAALATMDILEDERLLARGRELEGELAAVVRGVAESEVIGEVRAGIGLMAALDLAPEILADRPAAVAELAGCCREEGVFVRPLGRGIALSPPLIVDEGDLRAIGDAIGAGVERFAKLQPVSSR